jgi:hypothetical protein
MKKKRSLIILITLFFLIVLGYCFTKPAFRYLSGYLSKNDQVNANILVVEGWLPTYALEKAYDEYQKKKYDYIVTTGLKYSSDYYMLYMNGYLIFHPDKKLFEKDSTRNHTIEVNAYSELGGIHSAHFNVYINDQIRCDYNAEKSKHLYPVNWEGTLKDIDSIMIQFNNDAIGRFGDVNLYIKEIIIDHKIKIPYLNNSVYNIGPIDNGRRIANKFNSYAELARHRLLALGISPDKVIAIPGNRTRINRTLTSALAFREWLRTTNTTITGINIISMGTHARRTWMTYNKILDEKYTIGIISIEDYYSGKIRIFKTIREALGIIYYWFILIPY